MNKRIKDISGQQFGNLTVVKYIGRDTPKGSLWSCHCACGSVTVKSGRDLTRKRGGLRFCSRQCNLWKEHNRETQRRKRVPYQDPVIGWYKRYKEGAESRHYKFTLSFHTFSKLVAANCYYCGQAPTQKRINKSTKAIVNGVDRKNNNIGYIPSNCVPCCTTCNFAKGKLSEKEFINMVTNIFNYQKTVGNTLV